MHAHNVYFTLKDKSQAKVEELIAECKGYLSGIDGIESFACGELDRELARPVNDRDFDVSLHILFRDRAAHDAYQTSEPHEEFVGRNQSNWKQARVFDSTVRA